MILGQYNHNIRYTREIEKERFVNVRLLFICSFREYFREMLKSYEINGNLCLRPTRTSNKSVSCLWPQSGIARSRLYNSHSLGLNTCCHDLFGPFTLSICYKSIKLKCMGTLYFFFAFLIICLTLQMVSNVVLQDLKLNLRLRLFSLV